MLLLGSEVNFLHVIPPRQRAFTTLGRCVKECTEQVTSRSSFFSSFLAQTVLFVMIHSGSVPRRRQGAERRAALAPGRPQDAAAAPARRAGAAADPLGRVVRLQLPAVARARAAVGGRRPARRRAPPRVRVRHLRQVSQGPTVMGQGPLERDIKLSTLSLPLTDARDRCVQTYRFPHFIYKSTRKALEVNTLQPKQYNFLPGHSLLQVMIGYMNKLEGGRNNLAGPSNGMARYATTA